MKSKGNSHVAGELRKTAEYFKAGKLDLAEAVVRRLIAQTPSADRAHHNLGAILTKRGKPQEAIASYQRALKINPNIADTWSNLANALNRIGKHIEAEAAIRKALALNSNQAAFWGNLAWILFRLERFIDADAAARKAIALDPKFGNAYNTLGTILKRRGMLEEAIEAFKQALSLTNDAQPHSNLLFDMHFSSKYGPRQLAEEAERWNELHAKPLMPPPDRLPRPKGGLDKRLRVGMVSADFRMHPVSYFLAAILEARQPQHGWDAIGYSNTLTPDKMTERIKNCCLLWREVRGLDEEQLAKQIRGDEIDILFDLTGHTADNRLLAFARKPAPAQVTWLGYFDTTGLHSMDFLIADEVCLPRELEPFIKETVVRLPDGFLCYEPPAFAPPVGPLPALSAPRVTFGTANQIAKIGLEVATLWSQVLKQVPNADLCIKARGFSDPETREAYLSMFQAAGIVRDRLDFRAPGGQLDILNFYNEIDIALDPFPCAGGTTTCEALWMGVPVVSLVGDRFCSRHSASHLRNAGYPEFAVTTPEDYVRTAAALASDLERLSELREKMRPQLAASPLTDSTRFANNFSETLRLIWKLTLAKHN